MYTQDYTDMVKITSDFGKYNSENYDTIFSTNVIITYSDYKITGEYLEFSFDNSGTAKMTKKSDFELNEPKKVKKVFSFKSTLLAFYNKLVNRS